MSEQINHSQALPIDYSEVLDRIGGDRVFLNELLKIYNQEYEEKRDRLKRAIATENFFLIQELGHSLKGSSANLSLSLLRKAAYAIELAGRESDINKAHSALLSLENEFQRLQEFLLQNPPQDWPF